ncbi:TPA: type IV secretion system protein [Burkholderia cepacia]
MIRKLIVTAVAAVSIGSTGAHAQVPVTDGLGLVQWAQSVATAAQQLVQLENQLTQLQSTYNAISGIRNISDLLHNNLLAQYIPADYQAAYQLLRQGSSASSLSGISGTLNQIAQQAQLMNCSQSGGTTAGTAACNRAWQTASMNQYVGQAGYDNAAQNIANLQSFLQSIQSTPDPKAMQDLQARIALEQVKQQNEATKLTTIKMMQDAQDRMDRLNASAAANAVLTQGSGVRF